MRGINVTVKRERRKETQGRERVNQSQGDRKKGPTMKNNSKSNTSRGLAITAWVFAGITDNRFANNTLVWNSVTP